MMSVFSGLASNCRWSYVTGEPFNDEAWDKHIKSAFDLGQRLLPGATLLTIGWRAASPPPAARQKLAQRLREVSEKAVTLSGSAMVFDSALARGALTTINWIARKSYPEKVFATVDEAFAWLATRTPTFDAQLVWDSIVATVPSELLPVTYSKDNAQKRCRQGWLKQRT